jgi:hypothetical protein
MAGSEGDMSLKYPVTPPGIDPGTVRLVAQRLNHYATPVPPSPTQVVGHNIKIDRDFLHVMSNLDSSNLSIIRRYIMRDTFNVHLSIFFKHMQSVLDLPVVAGWGKAHHDHPAVGLVVFESVGSPCCCLQL